MRDLPAGLDLVELGRRLLLAEIAPLLPEERRRDLHLVATAIAIAAREAANAGAPLCEIGALLTALYDHDPHPPAASRLVHPLPHAGEGAEGRSAEAGEGECRTLEMLRRFALDLRKGEFETSQSQESAARAILWRLTILKLGEGNPQFLAAHGIE